MKKIKLILPILLLFLLTGCIKCELNVSVQGDATYLVTGKVLVNETNLKQTGKKEEDILNELSSAGIDICKEQCEIISEKYDGSTYRGYSFKTTQSDFISVTKDTYHVYFHMDNERLSKMINIDSLDGNDSDNIDFLKNIGVSYDLTVKMPRKISGSGTRTVTFDLLSEDDDIDVNCGIINIYTVFGLLGLFVAVFAANTHIRDKFPEIHYLNRGK